MKYLDYFMISSALLLFCLSSSVIPNPLEQDSASEISPRNISCSSVQDCQSVNGSICNDGFCDCPDIKPIFVQDSKVGNFCLPSLNLTEGNCTYSQQCNYEHGKCKDEICGCAARYVKKENDCVPLKRSSLIPIVVGSTIGILIVATVCVYFWVAKRKE